MKAVAFCDSARKSGNTALLLNTVLEGLAADGIATELVELAGQEIAGCKACFGCIKNKDRRCVVEKDKVNDYIAKMAEADIIVVGSTYWNIGRGREKGEAAGDEEGIATMKTLGENIAWLAKKL